MGAEKGTGAEKSGKGDEERKRGRSELFFPGPPPVPSGKGDGANYSFLGRPLFRSEDPRPSCSAVARVQSSAPNGRPRATERRRWARSLAERGALTRSSHA